MLLLMEHPTFDLHSIGASSRSAGKKYKDVVPWKQTKALPEKYGELVVKPCEPEEFKGCDIVFSGLDSSVAAEIEMAFLKANLAVFSNAKNYRQDPLIPLIVPTVNLDHFEVIPSQRNHFKVNKGFLVCNSNCAVIGLVIPFAAIEAAFGPIDVVSVVTEQALSGEWHTTHTNVNGADTYQAQAILACLRWTSLTTLYLILAEKKRRWSQRQEKFWVM